MKTELAILAMAVPLVVQADTFFAVGDIASCGDPPRAPLDSMAANTANWVPADADVLLLGDLVYPGGDKKYFDQCYRPTWGIHDAHAYPTLGNHEYRRDRTAAAYFDYFHDRPIGYPHGYYTIERKSWLLLALNSNLTGADFDEQLSWLKNILRLSAGDHSCILAFWHHPLYSSSAAHGYDESRHERLKKLWGELQRAHADVVLNGHDHVYESFAPMDENGASDSSGPKEFIVGTGGAPLDDFKEIPAPGSIARIAHQYAVMKLELMDRSYRWELINGENTLDSGMTACLKKADH